MKFTWCFTGSLVAVSLALFTGCAKVPDQELSAAKAALDSARIAEANIYVAADYAAANDSINAAVAEIEKQKAGGPLARNYDRAKSLIGSGITIAQRIRTQAQDAKQKLIAAVDSSLAQESNMLTEAKNLLNKAPKGKEAKPALEAMNTEIAAIEISFNEAQQDKATNNFMQAFDKLNAGSAKLDSITMELSSAIEKAALKKTTKKLKK